MKLTVFVFIWGLVGALGYLKYGISDEAILWVLYGFLICFAIDALNEAFALQLLTEGETPPSQFLFIKFFLLLIFFIVLVVEDTVSAEAMILLYGTLGSGMGFTFLYIFKETRIPFAHLKPRKNIERYTLDGHQHHGHHH
jgi:predicted ABC-type exoprotein transport system permease subunit